MRTSTGCRSRPQRLWSSIRYEPKPLIVRISICSHVRAVTPRLAFSLLHCLQQDNKLDHAYIDAHTLGYAEIEAAIEQATPQWGEQQTGVPAADIRLAAQYYGAGPALLWCGQGLQRQRQGWQHHACYRFCCRPLTGNIGKPGAGFCYLNVTPIFAGIDLDWLGGASIAREGGKNNQPYGACRTPH